MKRSHVVVGLGMLGTLTLLGMPLPTEGAHSSVLPNWAFRLLTLVQPGILVVLAAWSGERFAPRLGLTTPLICAALSRERALPILVRQLKAAAPAAILASVLVSTWSHVALPHLPERFIVAARENDIPLLLRVGYGGLSEEVMMRWGLMSAIAFGAWKLSASRNQNPTATVFWIATFLSSFLFGLGHLPMAVHLAGSSDAWLTSYIIVGNMAFAVAAGWLFWQYGLEAAMLAHVLVQLVAEAASRAGLS